MSAGKDAARDTRYGRRGGGWIPHGHTPPTTRRCDLCSQPMVVGQISRHLECCIAAGGLAAAKKPCNPCTFSDGDRKVEGCARCYLGGDT